MISKVFRLIGISAVMIGLVSCGSSKPSNYYLLSDLPSSQKKQIHHIRHKTIGVGPVVLAKYLNQPQIVTRRNLNHVNVDEFNRWAEPLDDNFARVLGKNLQKMMPSDDIVIYPWERSESLNYQVKVEVYRFDATTNGRVICDLRYEIIKTDTKERILSKSKTYTAYLGKKYSYTQLAHSMSRLITHLARDLTHNL